MKTSFHIYPKQHFIEIAPLALRYEVMAQAILAFVMAGRMREVKLYTRKIQRLIAVYARLDRHNKLWARKLEMLSNKSWRERVLRDLGGMRKLSLWEAAHKRIEARAAQGHKPARSAAYSTVPEPSWVRTPERIKESERLKAHVRKCLRAGAPPNVVCDRYATDFDGLFRLPALPRLRTASRLPVIYTKNSIEDYAFNGVPFGEVQGLGAAAVWPSEFYAAAALEEALTHPSPRPGVSSETPDTGPISFEYIRLPEPEMVPVSSVCKQTPARDEWISKAIPLYIAIPPETYRDIFENAV